MKHIEKQFLIEKAIKRIQKISDKACADYYKTITEFNPTDNNIAFGKMLACTEIRESFIDLLVKECDYHV